jgi:hypothetical protein
VPGIDDNTDDTGRQETERADRNRLVHADAGDQGKRGHQQNSANTNRADQQADNKTD